MPTVVVIFMLSVKFLYAGGSATAKPTASIINTATPAVETTSTSPAKSETPKDTQDNFLTSKDWLSIGIGAFLGWVLSLVTVLAIDYFKEPTLFFEVAPAGKDDPARKWKFIHIRIKNLKRKYKYSPFTTVPAFACKAVVNLRDKKFVGRWDSKAEPLNFVSGGAVLDLNAVLVAPREDIQPSPTGSDEEAVQVVIGLKYEGEKSFYCFNNENYAHQPDFRLPKHKLPLGVFEGEIKVFTLGKICKRKFRVHNSSSKRSDFWLELIK